MKTRIMIFGTFDMIHPGHKHMFAQARKLAQNPYLIVSIARDENVLKLKGKLPRNKETIRKQFISAYSLIDKVVLGGKASHMPHIIRENPDIIALGYDQVAYVQGLRKELADAGLTTKIIRLKPYQPEKYKTSIIKPR